jgi:uncharacterized DUF497 family protein
MYAQMCIYLPVSYEWDLAMAQANFAKHGNSFRQCRYNAGGGNLALTLRDPFSEDEERWIAPSTRCGLHLASGSCALDFSASRNAAREESIRGTS